MTTNAEWFDELRAMAEPVMCPELMNVLNLIKIGSMEFDHSYEIYLMHGGPGKNTDTVENMAKKRAEFREHTEAILKAHIAAHRAVQEQKESPT